jgi:hypothetical protein
LHKVFVDEPISTFSAIRSVKPLPNVVRVGTKKIRLDDPHFLLPRVAIRTISFGSPGPDFFLPAGMVFIQAVRWQCTCCSWLQSERAGHWRLHAPDCGCALRVARRVPRACGSTCRPGRCIGHGTGARQGLFLLLLMAPTGRDRIARGRSGIACCHAAYVAECRYRCQRCGLSGTHAPALRGVCMSFGPRTTVSD